jgi:hypothetical protein
MPTLAHLKDDDRKQRLLGLKRAIDKTSLESMEDLKTQVLGIREANKAKFQKMSDEIK